MHHLQHNAPGGMSSVEWFDAGVGDAEVVQLAAALRGTSVVKKIDLEYNPGLTVLAVEALRRVLPTCKVEKVWLPDFDPPISKDKLQQVEQLCERNTVRNKTITRTRPVQRLCLAKLFHYEPRAVAFLDFDLMRRVDDALEKSFVCPKGPGGIAAGWVAARWIEAVRSRREKLKREEQNVGRV